jgi:hypothetical protein
MTRRFEITDDAGLCPVSFAAADPCASQKEGAHGGTTGSPVLDFTLD